MVSSVISNGGGLTAQYFNSTDLNTNTLALTRIDSALNFNWAYGSPSSSIASDHFSARWTGKVTAPTDGNYTFYTHSDDGIRVWIDGKPVIDDWTAHASKQDQGTIALSSGQHDLKVEYYEEGGEASVSLEWAGPGFGQQVIPTSAFSPPSVTAPLAAGVTYVSDMTPNSQTNGWGLIERDLSNGEQGTADGRGIKIAGQSFSKGLGVHSLSEVYYQLSGNYSRFLSAIGVDDESGGNGTVDFQVWGDNQKLFDSGVVRGGTAARAIDIDVTGKQVLKLVVTDGGDGVSYDHADWADAKLISAGSGVSQPSIPVPTPVSPPIQIPALVSSPIQVSISAPVPPPISIPTPISTLSPAFDDSTLANEGHPSGVPSYYSWYDKPVSGYGNNPPSDWKAFTAWGQVYVEAGWNPPANSNTRVQLRNLDAWYLSKSTGQWVLLQHATRVDGADFKEDFANNASQPPSVKDESNNGGGTSIVTGNGYNYHFWTDRATIDPTDIAGIYTRFQSRLVLNDPKGVDDRASARYLASDGADYWRSKSSAWAADWSNNGGVGGGRLKFVTNDWQNFSMETLTPAQLRQNPPPIT